MNEDFCRICRGEETKEEPLYHPCRCSGSIKYVHQDCLLEWLQHARVSTKCDVCGTDYILHKKYRPGMTKSLPVQDYAVFLRNSVRDNLHVLYYVVRGVFMVSTLAITSKYVLEIAVIYSESSTSAPAETFMAEFKRRVKQSPPRESLIPILDVAASFFFPASEIRSAWINGILLILAFLACLLVIWFMGMWVLNEQALLHDLDHIAKGEISHMDQGDDEELLADFHSQNANVQHTEMRISEEDADHPQPLVEETVVQFQPRDDLFAESFPGIDADAEDPLLMNLEEEEGDDIAAFLLRLVAELFGGPNDITLRGYISTLVFFVTLAVSYSSVYWPSLILKQSAGSVLVHALRQMKVSPTIVEKVGASFRGAPTTIIGHVSLICTVQILVFTTIRLCILKNMRLLLKKNWGRNLVGIAYQAYAVSKTLLMVLIETLIFPQFCGILIHVAILPITPHWTWHWQAFRDYPYWTLFSHWLSGYIYMHMFQIFVGACRSFFRQGVLFFLHTNDAVYFMRSIMILSLPKQIRRISTSAQIYGGFILFGIGSATLLLRYLEPNTWPLELLYWPGINILKLWPCVIICSSLWVPLTGQNKLKSVLKLWLGEKVWLRMFVAISTNLDLESFLFAKQKALSEAQREKLAAGDTSDGNFVRAPVEIPLRPRQSLKLFTPVTAENVRLDGKKGIQQDELNKYTIVWRPAHFKLRLALMAFYVWIFVTLLTLTFTLVPLQLGRALDYLLFNKQIRNDIILTVAGLSILLPVTAELLCRFPPRELQVSERFRNISGTLPRPTSKDATEALLWSAAFSILCQNPQNPWTHWLLVTSRPKLNQGIAIILNSIGFFVGNLYSGSWCNAIATGDFFICQFVLELLNITPKSPLLVFAGLTSLMMYRLWQVWIRSKAAVKLSESVREALYLEATEIRNYD